MGVPALGSASWVSRLWIPHFGQVPGLVPSGHPSTSPQDAGRNDPSVSLKLENPGAGVDPEIGQHPEPGCVPRLFAPCLGVGGSSEQQFGKQGTCQNPFSEKMLLPTVLKRNVGCPS